MTVSVLTLVRGRAAHLAMLIEGLNRQTQPPDELVIAYMQSYPAACLPEARFPVRTLFVTGDPMPLAAARNRAAEAASGDLLLFLDVDCVPAPDLVARYAAVAAARDGVLLGEVLYLPAGALDDGLDYDRLDRLGRRHPAKPAIGGDEVRDEPDHGELWGLSFALPATVWAQVGGMDESFTGYGAEETDFGARLAAARVPMAWVGGARAYHQHHAVHIPPLQHFDHILRNATLFRARWGRWCMDYWLGQFRDRGLIAWDADAIHILRQPTAAEVAATRAGGDILFS
jgi:GT2 family glycosyltransferase